MALDDKAVERMLRAQREALQPSSHTPGGDNSHLFEEFQRPAKPGEAPKPKGLNALGYRFPPTVGEPPLTKENLAKGIGLQPLPPSREAAPPTELVASDPLFEEYQRPDLKDKPRTGHGLRHAVLPKTAKEILQGYEPPTPQVFTAKRVDQPREPAAPTPTPTAPPLVPAPSLHAAATATPPAKPAPTPLPAAAPPPTASQQEVAAHLDAEADLATAPELTMSHSRSHGPTRTVTDHDPFAEMPELPGEKRRAPSGKPASASPHLNDAPPVEPGDGPRVALVQADFNHGITTRMAQAVRDAAAALGCDVLLHVHVAGVFDVPLVAKALAKRADVDAVVAVGCVIQGETGHDELIARECARLLADLAYQAEKPVGLAVTGPRMTRQAAEARAETAPRHAVEAVVKQWRALKAIGAARIAAR